MYRVSHATLAVVLLTVFSACGGGASGSGSGAASTRPVVDPSADNPPHCDGSGGIFRASSTDLGLCYVVEPDADVSQDPTGPPFMGGGLALADIDNDGLVELYVAHGSSARGQLFSYDGDRFVRLEGNNGINPAKLDQTGYFIDLDADGWRDFVSNQYQQVEIFMNDGTGHFVEATAATNITHTRTTHSMAAGDFNRDGSVDLFFAHWGGGWDPSQPLSQYLWQNDGTGRFTDVSAMVPIQPSIHPSGLESEFSFTPTFSDINSDGYPDLLVAGDHMSSQVFKNEAGSAFTDITTPAISDENGMGSAVADYDRDGDLDWFVSSIATDDGAGTGAFGGTGNRLYRNVDGLGNFEDVTDEAGVRDGDWGWGSCFADFNNDGHLDIFHTNGFDGAEFVTDPSRLFMSNGDGTFSERAAEIGVDHTEQGRGIVCADYNGDGKVDIFISNNGKSPSVFTNDHDNGFHYLAIDLRSSGANPAAIGARVVLNSASGSQTQEVQLGRWYLSQGPQTLHFGLGGATRADLEVRWPDGSVSNHNDVAVDRLLTLDQERSNLQLVVAGGVGAGSYEIGDEIPIQANDAQDDYFFSHWSSNNGGRFADPAASDTTFTMPGGTVTVIANYVPGVAPGAEVSVARRWNEVLLQAIRNDYARPTVHARNLFHLSAAAYDVWTAYTGITGSPEVPWLLGRTRAGESCAFAGFDDPAGIGDLEAAREAALSYATYRLIRHRFAASPGAAVIRRDADALMGSLGHSIDDEARNYSAGSPAALGNHLADCYIRFGLADGANEAGDYTNLAYTPVNVALEPVEPGNSNLTDLNRWQPLSLVEFIDQAGNETNNEPEFLSPEWGRVVPFALSEADLTVYQRDGFDYRVYHDPGMPPTFDGALADNYKWTFALVAIWSSQLDPSDEVMVDISPASLGNISAYPTEFSDYADFYDTFAGGDASVGYDVNPVTGAPYTPQLVLRGDYGRVLAEFWADGPDSETPPGHWFVIVNTVNEHPLLERRFGGVGEELGRLEWDVKTYFLLGGTMHDAAVTAWGVKGWYDYIRPISALRAMAGLGQSSDVGVASYHLDGVPLHPGYIELVQAGDALAGDAEEHLGKIKFRAWRGPGAIRDPLTEVAGVGWILAENWWPYQRPTFVTPPFAGYVSGHSTYSRAAAELLTALTGDPFFPGGKSDFEIPANEFLVFEDGPSVAMTLEWATYRDASDQCSLSRIWGGIHPPADDIPGRLMGIEIGKDAFVHAAAFFDGSYTMPDP